MKYADDVNRAIYILSADKAPHAVKIHYSFAKC